jgi:hypothetical protein
MPINSKEWGGGGRENERGQEASSSTLSFFIILHENRIKRLARDKHSSLLGAFVSCKENEIL